MTRLAVAAAAALAAAPLFAGVRILSEDTDLATNKTTTDQILLDTNRIRLDDGDKGNSVLFLTDGGNNRMVLLDRRKNEYQEIDEQTMKQLGQQLSGMMALMQERLKALPPEQRAKMEQMMKGRMPAAAAGPKIAYDAEGSGTVNGFSCTKYDKVEGAEKTAELCVAQPAQINLTAADLQTFEKMKEFSASLVKSLTGTPFSGRAQSLGDFGIPFAGIPIQDVHFENGRATRRSNLKSVTRTSFSDADFSLGNAKKMELPELNLPRGKTR